MMLPEGIEILKRNLDEKEKLESIDLISKLTTAPSTALNDVEYYEDIESSEDMTIEDLIKANLKDEKVEPSLPRPYSIDLWNGSPVLPNFENVQFERNVS